MWWLLAIQLKTLDEKKKIIISGFGSLTVFPVLPCNVLICPDTLSCQKKKKKRKQKETILHYFLEISMMILNVLISTTHPVGHIPATLCCDHCLKKKKEYNFSSHQHKNTFNNKLTNFFKKPLLTNLRFTLIATAKNWPEKDETAGKYQSGSVWAAFD